MHLAIYIYINICIYIYMCVCAWGQIKFLSNVPSDNAAEFLLPKKKRSKGKGRKGKGNKKRKERWNGPTMTECTPFVGMQFRRDSKGVWVNGIQGLMSVYREMGWGMGKKSRVDLLQPIVLHHYCLYIAVSPPPWAVRPPVCTLAHRTTALQLHSLSDYACNC